MIGCSPEYLAHLKRERETAARRACEFSTEMLLAWDGLDEWSRRAALDTQAQLHHMTEVYTRQIDWHQRDTGTAWPATPAWSN